MLLGAIADDLTGATDLSLMLSRNGMKTIQVIGVPDTEITFDDAEAVVVALKSRTIPAPQAVELSLESAARLLDAGAEQIFFKYCSTFDSTDAGNIGPVAAALLDHTKSDLTIACPAFPATGRTVYRGHLFVGDLLLSDSPMKDHPLTPMRDPNIVKVLERQVGSPVGLVPLQTVEKGPRAILAAVDHARNQGIRFVVIDAIRDEDLRTIGEACAGMRLLTGGSGIAMGLPDNFRKSGRFDFREPIAFLKGPPGRSVILAGSCSSATRRQVSFAIESGLPNFKLDPLAIAEGRMTADQVVDWAENQPVESPPLIYSSGDPDSVREIQEILGVERSGSMVEEMMAEIGSLLAERGFTRFLIAGGETSGAVVNAIGVRALHIGPEIDPGVPWTQSIGARDMCFALKSGNFGAQDMFQKAWRLLQ